MRWLVTGGAGFIGSCFVLDALRLGVSVLTLDKLTYSGNMLNLSAAEHNPLHRFIRGDIGDAALLRGLLEEFQPDALINFAAESHVDRSILAPDDFIQTNALGTHKLLQASLDWWKKLPPGQAASFRFLHISTDEVFGSLRPGEAAFTESTPYAPNSPYSASKAASDHFTRAYHATYGLPTLIGNCSNNYGPRQFPEKFIPLIISRLLAGEEIPIYGAGENIRDWLHVEDHCAALRLILAQGAPGLSYNIGGRAERRNIDVARAVCALMDELAPGRDGPHARRIRFVGDRAGHDFRYAVNSSRLEQGLGWRRVYEFEQGLKASIVWYLENHAWLQAALSGAYREWTELNYGKRPAPAQP